MRQLRDTRQIDAWIEAGETLRLHKRDRLVAEITPIRKPNGSKKEWPDFEARAKKIFGDRVLDADAFIHHRHGRY